jgi:hypothetical protein
VLTEHDKLVLRAAVHCAGGDEVCYAGVLDEYRAQGVKPSDFRRLASAGYLVPGRVVRGGGRKYYRLDNEKIRADYPGAFELVENAT